MIKSTFQNCLLVKKQYFQICNEITSFNNKVYTDCSWYPIFIWLTQKCIIFITWNLPENTLARRKWQWSQGSETKILGFQANLGVIKLLRSFNFWGRKFLGIQICWCLKIVWTSFFWEVIQFWESFNFWGSTKFGDLYSLLFKNCKGWNTFGDQTFLDHSFF